MAARKTKNVSTRKKPAAKRSKAGSKRKPARGPSVFERLGSISRNYFLAGAAGLGVILLGGAGVLWAGGYFGVLAERADEALGASAIAAGFEVKRVTLKGRHSVADDELQAAVGDIIGASLLHFDAAAARARIEELGWVRAAAVSRLLPDTVHVSIREREPAAVWQIAGDLHLIDDAGAIIREVGAYEYSSLPLIVGAGAPESAAGILKALGPHEALRERASALVRVGERRWNLRLQSGLDVKLPSEGFAAALDTLARLDAAHGLLDQPLEYIDLRDPERMVIRRLGEDAPETVE